MSERSIQEYNRRASHYEKKWGAYLAHTHHKFLENLAIENDDVILDVSGGTGLLAEELLNGSFPFKKLIVNDPSEGMLQIAKNRLKGNSKISFSNSVAGRLSFENNYFDCILCLNSFHFYPNQEQVVEEFRRLLKPGGRLYMLDWNRSGFFRIVNRVISWLAAEYIDTCSLAEIEQMLVKGGFKLTHSESWSWRYWRFYYVISQK